MQLQDNIHCISWSKNSETRKLVGVLEASDIGIRAGQRWPSTFTLKSSATGRVVMFRYARAVLNRAGTADEELCAQVYVPAQADLLRYPHLVCVEIHILND
jgi:hypothetical protein